MTESRRIDSYGYGHDLPILHVIEVDTDGLGGFDLRISTAYEYDSQGGPLPSRVLGIKKRILGA